MGRLLREISSRAGASFADIPFPHGKDEYWRFADLRSWGLDSLFEYFSSSIRGGDGAGKSDYSIRMGRMEAEAGCSPASVTVFDGRIMSANLPEGVVAVSFPDAEENFPGELAAFYGDCRGKFDTLQASRAEFGAALIVADGADAELDLTVVSKLPLSPAGILVIVGESASLKLGRRILNYAGSFGVLRSRYVLRRKSLLESASVKMSETCSHSYEREDFCIGDGAVVRDALAQIGLSPSRHERNFYMDSSGADLDTRTFLSIGGNTTHDLRTEQRHSRPESKSNLAVRAAVSGSGALAFTGLIGVLPGAQKTEAYQSCRSLLLSDKAKAQASPVLEIRANDVVCSHGCTVSNPDADQLFYMRQRGLNLADARRLIVRSFAETAFAEISNRRFADSIMDLAFPEG